MLSSRTQVIYPTPGAAADRKLGFYSAIELRAFDADAMYTVAYQIVLELCAKIPFHIPNRKFYMSSTGNKKKTKKKRGTHLVVIEK